MENTAKRELTIHDSVYGTATITSPVLITLIESRPVQRMKKIGQNGVPDEFYYLKNFSRYDHCVGVMLLLRLLGASEEEQIAGLLHDVSHTAFSHLTGWIFHNGGKQGSKEDYQDLQHARVILASEIPRILETFGYQAERIGDYHHHFGLLERNIPDLCADRIDYSLREFPLPIARRCVAAMTVHVNKIVFQDEASATLFATHFLECQKTHWGGFEAATRYELFSRALKRALQLGLVQPDDFWQDDEYVMKKIIDSSDKELQKIFAVLRYKSLAHFPREQKPVYSKFRYVDPEFLHAGGLARLTDVNPAFKQEVEIARNKTLRGIYPVAV